MLITFHPMFHCIYVCWYRLRLSDQNKEITYLLTYLWTLSVWQVYGIFIIPWQFVIPLIIFIVAYWKILGVVRRQAKIAADQHHITTKSNEPIAGTSAGTATAETANTASSKDDNQRDEVAVKGAEVGNQQVSKFLSKAQINVVITMIYITVGFTVCWMPMYTTIMATKISVKQLKFLLTARPILYLTHLQKSRNQHTRK